MNIKYRSKKFEPERYIGSGTHFLNALKKYGKQNFKCILLKWCYSEDDLTESEQYWIAKYNAVEDPNFYNLSLGGESGSFGIKRSKESILKQVQSTKGKHYPNKQWDEAHKQNYINSRSFEVTDETREKISTALKDKPFTKDHCNSIRDAKQNISEETRKKMSISQLNREDKMSQESRNNISLKLSIPIQCLETGEIFRNAGEVDILNSGKVTGNTIFSIENLTSAFGKHYVKLENVSKPYTEEERKFLLYSRLARLGKKDKPIKCLETEEIFKSVSKAEHSYNIFNIMNHLKGNQKTAGGYHWAFITEEEYYKYVENKYKEERE